MLSFCGLDAQVMGRLDALYALIDDATARQEKAAAALNDAVRSGTAADVAAAEEGARQASGLVLRASERYRMSFGSLDPQSQRDYLRLRHPELLVDTVRTR